MPLVYFSIPFNNRFISTLKRILKSGEIGGLTSNVGPLVIDYAYLVILIFRHQNLVIAMMSGSAMMALAGKKERSVSVRAS